MRATSQTVLDAPIDRLDLNSWMFTLSSEEYRAAARGHHAAGLLMFEDGRGTINVESVGGNLAVQLYRALHADATSTELYSARSMIFLFHLVPVTAKVRWIMELAASSPDRTVLTCTVEVELSPVLTMLANTVALPFFLRKHVEEETVGFARDMIGKLAAAV